MAGIRNSIRGLWRTPVKTVLFFLLLAFTVALVCAGANLKKLCGDNLKRFEEIFMTIGIVEQMPERTEQKAVWEADREDFRYFAGKVYGETVSSDVLDFAGAGYISGPEQRAYYEALALDYKLKEDNEGYWQYMIIEASPLEDCVPAGPVKIEVKRVLYSVYPVNTNPVYLCDHNTEQPQTLYADKTYLMALGDGFTHTWEELGSQSIFEFVPISGPWSTQTDKTGKRLPTEFTGDWIAEVTPGFYETAEGKAWLNLCEDFAMREQFFPVTATQDLNLIMAFYTKLAYLKEGELFAEEDYSQGNKVCLVSDRFAWRNGLKVGDSLHLALRFANYADSPTRGGFGAAGYLDAKGEVYQPFEESDYEIKGIYDVGVAGDEGDWGYRLDRNEVFIPTASIKNSNENNIALYGPMKGYTTAFRIPNGIESIENYKRLWEAQGVDNVEITFYDGGYSKLESGLVNMRNMSLLLLVTGSVSAVCIVIFFCHLFITKQKKRTAIERGLGMTKGQCVRSLLAGILLLALAGSAVGAFTGRSYARRAAAQMERTELFDTRFSNGAVQLEQERKENDIGKETETGAEGTGEETGAETEGTETGVYLTETDWRISAVCGGSVFLLTFMVAAGSVWRNLKQEPLALLTTE